MRTILFRLINISICLFAWIHSQAQFTPVSYQPGEDMLRAAQLINGSTTSTSFTIRPTGGIVDPYKVLDSGWKRSKKWLQFSLLPFSTTVKYNTKRPFGWNDGAFSMRQGFQQILSGGLFAKLGPLEIQVQPEWLHAGRSTYQTTSAFGVSSEPTNKKLYPGQSSIQLRFGSLALGVGSRSITWGPGQFSSILMSNNAPGFQHAFIQSDRPLKTPIGYLEWQLIGGLLNEDTARAMENNFLRPMPILNKKRYISGFAATWQPRFMKGFSLGVSRVEQAYLNDIENSNNSFFAKYISTFKLASPVDNANQVGINTDGAVSFFLRWKLPKSKTELYAEYGYNDFKQNFRDLAVNTNHSSAYILGFKKIFGAGKTHWDLSGELTQMAQTTSYLVRSAGNWYVHGGVSQGLTYQNQLMGAGSGFGNNVQTLQLIRRNGFDQLGIRLQRVQNDPKAIAGVFNNLGMRDINWNDCIVGLIAQKRWGKFYVKGEINGVNSRNYGWEKGNIFNVMFQSQCGIWW